MYRVHAAHNFMNRTVEIRCIDVAGDITWAASLDDHGLVQWTELPAHTEPEPLLELPRDMVGPIVEALSDEDPPADTDQLRESLEVERDRVDRVLDTLIEQHSADADGQP